MIPRVPMRTCVGCRTRAPASELRQACAGRPTGAVQSVLYGFKAFKVEETAKEIARNVENLSRHLRAYEDYFRKLGASLSTTVNHYNAAYEELSKIDKDVLRITGESPGFQPARVERPQEAE